MSLDHVNYDALDDAKNAFIRAGKKTASYAKKYGRIPSSGFGASANVFNLDLKPFLKTGAKNLFVTLLPEGLGTSDDARPDDLTEKEAERFWHHVGVKANAVMTNDAAATGMQPVLISLYLPSSNPELVFNKTFMKGFLDGFTEACKKVGCVYFSGETPQLKGKIVPGKLDIAGALFGVMPPGVPPVDGRALKAGDKIVFIASSGPHDNGFTSLRELAGRLPQGYRTKLPDGRPYWEAIMEPTVLYTPLVQAILKAGIVPSNIEPISGHGWQKLMRSKKPLRYVIRRTLPVPPIFEFVQKHSGTPREAMIKIFNYGVGLAVYVKTDEDAVRVVRLAKKQGLSAVVAGEVQSARRRQVVVEPWNIVLEGDRFKLQS